MSSAAALVLVVEDEQGMHRFLRVLLESQGYRVATAKTGEAALREVTTRPPDAILMDIGLPDIDGLELTRRIREWSQVPIVVISARGREQDKVEALDLGADDYVTKPSIFERAALWTVGLSAGVTRADAPSSLLASLTTLMFLGRLETFTVLAALCRLMADMPSVGRRVSRGGSPSTSEGVSARAN